MSLPVNLRREAQRDYDEAFDWYDAQRAGLGTSFANAVQAILDKVGRHPETFALITDDIRHAALKRFPYVIYYRIHSDRIEIVAVFHTSRDPSIWQDRI